MNSHLLISLTLLTTVGCTTQQSLADCGDGRSFETGELSYCVYGGELIIEGFECPQDLHRFDLGENLVACGTEEQLPEDDRSKIEERFGDEGWCTCESGATDCLCDEGGERSACTYDSQTPWFSVTLRDEPLGAELEWVECGEGTVDETAAWGAGRRVFVEGASRTVETLRAAGVNAGEVVTLAFSVPASAGCHFSPFNPGLEISNPDGSRTGEINDGMLSFGGAASDRWLTVEIQTFAGCDATYSMNVVERVDFVTTVLERAGP